MQPAGCPNRSKYHLCLGGGARCRRPPLRGRRGESATVRRWVDPGHVRGRDPPAQRVEEREEIHMNTHENTEAMLGIFSAIEHRDFQRLLDFCQPDVEFLWPPSLPSREASAERGPRRGAPCSRPRPSGGWTLVSSPPAGTRSWCSGRSAASVRPGIDSTAPFSRCISCATGSWPVPRCSTSTPWAWPAFSRRHGAIPEPCRLRDRRKSASRVRAGRGRGDLVGPEAGSVEDADPSGPGALIALPPLS